MATQLLIRHVCDLKCGTVQDGDETDIRTFPLNILGDEREIDLCISCAAKVVSQNIEVIEASRKPSKNGKPQKRTRIPSGAIAIEVGPDGKFTCPECGRVTGTSGSGLGLHMRDKHPAERGKYRIIEPPKQKAAPRTKRAAKKAPARKRVPVRR